jgi:transcriptional regulator with XRE-family HTH domain
MQVGVHMLPANGNEFSTTLKSLRSKSGKSQYRLAQYSGINEAYLSRLESGARQNPSRDVIMKLGPALASDTSAVSLDDVNELPLSAGYAPLRGRGEQLTPP